MEERNPQQNQGAPEPRQQSGPPVPPKQEEAQQPASLEPAKQPASVPPPVSRPAPQKPAEQQQPMPPAAAEQPKEEPQEILSRRDVRTMEKDLAEVREGEASQERDKISQMKVSDITKKQAAPTPEKEESSLMPGQAPVVPAASASHRSKLLVRLLVGGGLLVLLLGAGGLGFYLSQQEEEPVAEQQQEEQQAPVQEEEAQIPEPELAAAPFSVEETLVIPTDQSDDIPQSLEEALPQLKEGFTRIAFQSPETREFFDPASALISLPEEIRDQESALLGYVIPERQRLALLTPAEELSQEQLRSWETAMAEAPPMFMGLQGTKETGVTSFRSTNYRDTEIRFLTYSIQDLGIVYAQLNNTFIVTGSLEGMQKVIDNLIL